jgi:DNA-binding CsgD family transcriptional regulator
VREVTRADPSPQPSRTRPLVLVTAGADVETVVNGLRSQGWHVQRGFNAPNPIADRQRLICVGPVLTTQDAAAAVLAAMTGAGIVADVFGATEAIVEQLNGDLRTFGPVDVLTDDRQPGLAMPVAVSPESAALLVRLADGASLQEAASSLAMSRRTADRRLAEARQALGVRTTAEAVVLARRLGLVAD